ncbi:hypothetical protein ACH4SP_15150 [Streptomyces sp. NPDC021093]|uniref:hypothetical protein n=1 Tax=Streptomyces sp. NPDC021093 TaxID=3365112 RepID=UPI0037BA3FB3
MYLLSLPECATANVRDLAKQRKEGRDRIAGALRELEEAGYLRRPTASDPVTGQLATHYEVFDTPYDRGREEGEDGAGRNNPQDGRNLASGAAPSGDTGGKPSVSNTSLKEPTSEVPSPAPPPPSDGDDSDSTAAALKGKAARFLHALCKNGPAELSLSIPEAFRLAPQVMHCWEAGVTEPALRHLLTRGLPEQVQSTYAMFQYRLNNKCDRLPPPKAPVQPVLREKCEGCGAGLVRPGRCSACAAEKARAASRTPREPGEPVALGEVVEAFAEATRRGAEAVRAAMRPPVAPATA